MYASARSPGAMSVPGGVDDGWNSDPPESPAPLSSGRRYTMARLSRRPQHGAHRRALPISLDVIDLEHDEEASAPPPPVQEHAATSADTDCVYIHGGATARDVNSGELWAMRGRRWRQVAPHSASSARRGHTLTHTDDGVLLVYGGYGERGEVLARLMVFDPHAAPHWEVVDAMRGPHGGHGEPVAHHSAVYRRNRVYFYGGETLSGAVYPYLQSFDTRSRVWQQHEVGQRQSFMASIHPPDVPTGRQGHTAHLYTSSLVGTDSMLVFGGRVEGGACTNDVFSFSFEDEQWTKVYSGGVVPAPRAHHSAVCVKDQLVVYGGVDADGRVLDDCFYLNLVTNTWRAVGLRLAVGPRCGHTASLWVDRAGALQKLIVGGTAAATITVSAAATRYAKPTATHHHPTPPGAAAVHDKSDFSPRDKSAYGTTDAAAAVGESPSPVADKADVTDAAPDPEEVTPAAAAAAMRPNPAPISAPMLVTLGVSHERRARPRRPKTAPVGGGSGGTPVHIPIKPTAKSQGRQLFNHSAIASPRTARGFLKPTAPGEQPPWTVSTNKANTAREFGEAPEVPYGFRYAKTLSSEVVDSVVNRLSDTSHSAVIHEALAKKYLFEPEQQHKPKVLTQEAVDRSVDRMYHQQLELQDEYRRTLEAKYVPTRDGKKLTKDDIVNMVHRLGAVPDRADYWGETPTRRPRNVDLQKSVDRLFYESIKHVEARKHTLQERYAAKRQMPKISTDRMMEMVDRLYVVNPAAPPPPL